MEQISIHDKESLGDWLADKPAEWAQAIALRAALRVLPEIAGSSERWLHNFALLPFGALLTSWLQLVDPPNFVRTDANRANGRFGGPAFDFELYTSEPIGALAADSSYHSADAQSKSIHVLSDSVIAVRQAAAVFGAQYNELRESGGFPARGEGTLWESVCADCQRLIEFPGKMEAKNLAISPLWDEKIGIWADKGFRRAFYEKLNSGDLNYSGWIEWYERRVQGARAAFDIPGDKRRVEDKKILRCLAEATNQDFWDKGHQYVNATLNRWLDEARARAARDQKDNEPGLNREFGVGAYGQGPYGGLPEEYSIPRQQSEAIAYGVNADGKLDRLPHRDQVHLRDDANQRRAYRDLRKTANDLSKEGQRLGPKLRSALSRFTRSLPAKFEDAEAYLVWRDGNFLRRLYYAHQSAARSREPDEAKLEPVVAEELGGLLDLFNAFAFADDGIRAKDHQRIAPQEQAKAEIEDAAATPLVEAILASPDLTTGLVREDIGAQLADATLAADDPYAAQVLEQANLTRANMIAGLIEGAKKFTSSPKRIGFNVSRGIAAGIGTAIGGAVVAGAKAIGIPLLEFVANHAAVLQIYVVIAFSSYAHLPELIEYIKQTWLAVRAKL